jgi:Tol biopolymer transport system component
LRRVAPLLILAALLLPASAQAAFPGANGKIAFDDVRDDPNPSGCYPNCNWEIYSINPDGTGATRLTNHPGVDVSPAWSPDGKKIVFNRYPPTGFVDIVVMNADGSGQTSLGSGYQPSWSPDGSKIVFVAAGECSSGDGGLWTMNPDGTGRTFLACGPPSPAGVDGETAPVWRPNGNLVAFGADLTDFDIFTVQSNGTNRTNLTNSPNEGDRDPNWSPDGSRIAFGSGEFSVPDIWTMNSSGGQKTNLTNDAPDDRDPAYSPDGTKIVFRSARASLGLHVISSSGSSPSFLTTGEHPDWQPIPINAYPRPRGATPMRIALVPAYDKCSSPNSTHGAPLAFPSCNPPALISQYLTVGTPDANGKRTTMEGFILLRTVVGNPSTPADEADVRITARVNNVFNKDLTDYTGGLAAWFRVQITDRRNTPSPGGPGAGTMFEIPLLLFTMNCAADPDPQIGSDCGATTTVDAMFPGAVTEGDHAVWQIGKAEVYDGGSDGDPITADNTLFATQGTFIP